MTLYLADACALIDFYTGAPDLPQASRTLLADDTESVGVSATVVWEIAIKQRLGKLVDIRHHAYPALGDMLADHGFTLMPFDHATAEQAAALPPLHGDPFDRALVALAQRTGRVVVTRDATIGRYGVPVFW